MHFSLDLECNYAWTPSVYSLACKYFSINLVIFTNGVAIERLTAAYIKAIENLDSTTIL